MAPKDIRVQCVNKFCGEKKKPKSFPPELAIAEGEQIVCGGCGHEVRFIGADRPKRDKEFDHKSMNRGKGLIDFEEEV